MKHYLVATLAAVCCLTGCTKTKWVSQTRSWNLTYKETITVNTEPTNARVYAQGEFVGTSPVDVTLEGGELRVVQSGERLAVHRSDVWGRDRGFKEWGSSTIWRDDLDGAVKQQKTWTFLAYKDGYNEGKKTVSCCNSESFHRAIRQLRVGAMGKLPAEITGTRSIVIALRPQFNTNADAKVQQQQQQQTIVLPEAKSQGENFGTVVVSCPIQDAEILVDGAFVGNTPARLVLVSGIHILEVKKLGYESFRREVRILADSEVTLNVKLQKE